MASFLTLSWLFLAQTESSNIRDFLGQVSGLVALTCVAGIVWVALTMFVMQRAAERRRRAALGLDPLPPFYAGLWHALRGERAASTPAARLEPAAPARRPAAPLPDLSLLTGEVPAPGPLPPEPEPEPDLLGGVPPAEGEPADAVELLRVWRDLASGALIVEIDGRRFQSADELRRAGLERRLNGVMQDLNALIGRAAAGLPRPAAEEPPAPPAESSLRHIARVAMGQPTTPPAAPAPRSIADQIEDLLQQRLAAAPAFHGREIHVKPSLHGGVQIVVDDRQYEGVGDIDDPEVRALIEDVVREWEADQ